MRERIRVGMIGMGKKMRARNKNGMNGIRNESRNGS